MTFASDATLRRVAVALADQQGFRFDNLPRASKHNHDQRMFLDQAEAAIDAYEAKPRARFVSCGYCNYTVNADSFACPNCHQIDYEEPEDK